MNADAPVARVAGSAAELVEKGFLWIYRDRITSAEGCEAGQLVRVEDPKGRTLGWAHYSDRSKIALRLVDRGQQQPEERALYRQRLIRAAALRDRVLPGRQARRLVYSEADLLPGLVVDQYGDAFSVQTLTQAAEKRQELLLELLDELFQPRLVVLRNDVRVREHEGLPLYRRAARGEAPFLVEVQGDGLRQVVDLWEGQKTGAFLDQQLNHLYARQVARGRVLDLFSYSGGFALHAALAAERVLAVDSSQTALGWAEESARRSGLLNIEWVCANVFDYIRNAAHGPERFDLVIVDPPAFAKRRSDLAAAQKGYRDLNRRALQLLAPGGVLITCSCSYNLAEADFVHILRQAAESANRRLVLVERRGQSPDHPEALGLPESRYLKCLVAVAD